MRNKLFYLFVIIGIFSIIIISEVFAFNNSNGTLSNPEETLNIYIDALREGNIDKILECYYSDRGNFKFHLTGPMQIRKYEIVKKKIYTDQMADEYRAIPKARAGDIEFDVKEYFDDREEMFTYLFRQINQEWRIISHTSWSQPD